MASPAHESVVSRSQVYTPDKTLGAYLLGTSFGLILYGFVLHQMYKYYRLFRTDASFIRSLETVLILETLHTTLTLHLSYFLLVTNYSDLAVSIETFGPWSLNIQPVFLSFTILASQIFFARRVFEIGPRHRVAAAFSVLFLVGQVGFATATTYLAFVTPENIAITDKAWLISVSMGMPLMADLILTTTLIITLSRSRSSFMRGSLVDLVITYVVNTGLLHCIFNALAFAFTLGRDNRGTFLYLLFNTISTRVYANSFMSVLNSRDALSKRGVEVLTDGQYGLNLIARAHRQATAETWNLPQTPEPEQTRVNIHITTEHEDWNKLRDASHLQTDSRPESV